MKNLILFALLLVVSFCEAQTTTTEVTRLNGDGFAITTTTLDAQDRVTATKTDYYTAGEFAALAVTSNNTQLVQADELTNAATVATRDARQLERFVVDSLGINYDSIQVAQLSAQFLGGWKLREGGTLSDVEIVANPNSSAVLRIRQTGGRVSNLAILYQNSFRVPSFWGEPVVFQRLPNGAFLGTLANGTVLILRKIS